MTQTGSINSIIGDLSLNTSCLKFEEHDTPWRKYYNKILITCPSGKHGASIALWLANCELLSAKHMPKYCLHCPPMHLILPEFTHPAWCCHQAYRPLPQVTTWSTPLSTRENLDTWIADVRECRDWQVTWLDLPLWRHKEASLSTTRLAYLFSPSALKISSTYYGVDHTIITE
jgi:hypothetical protein